MTKINLEEKVFIWFTILGYNHGVEVRARNWAAGHIPVRRRERTWACLFLLSLLLTLTEFMKPWIKKGAAHMSWVLFPQSTLYVDTLQAGLISHWHSSQVALDCVKLTIKNNHHTIIFGSVEDRTQGFGLTRQTLSPQSPRSNNWINSLNC